MMPRYPIYIPSKSRWSSRLTSRALERLGVPYRIVVEREQFDAYAGVIDPAKILVLPFSGRGLVPTRNWIWEHSIAEGHARHWQIDDNVSKFSRFNRNRKVRVTDGTIFRAMEDFADRYTNVAIAGPQYWHFVKTRVRVPPFLLNTRIYSILLLGNEFPARFRFRGIYNDDTDLALRYLKAGYCTILFQAFLAAKSATMTVRGGNTGIYLQHGEFDGRLAMARSLEAQHPDVVTVVRKFGRWQHHVDYRPFKANALIRRADAPAVVVAPNEYGMRLVRHHSPPARGARSADV